MAVFLQVLHLQYDARPPRFSVCTAMEPILKHAAEYVEGLEEEPEVGSDIRIY
jgi:hypothetical protein